MSYEQILAETVEPTLDSSAGDSLAIRRLTLNRPDKLNAWTYTMNGELVDAIEEANADDSIGAIVVTGAGRGFCAGADISDTFASRLDGPTEERGSRPTGDWVALCRRSKPLIAAVNGVAVGVGITMVLPFDVLIAASTARVGMFFVKMGLVPELASSHFLVQRVGFALASEMCLSGRLYDAAELAGSGFFNRIVATEDLMTETLGLASTIAANPPSALRRIKELLTRNGAESDLAAVQRREHEALGEAYRSPEHRRAVESFLSRSRKS